VAVTVSAILSRARPTAFFRYFLVQLLLFNLLNLGGLVVRFLELELREGHVSTDARLIPAILVVLSGLKLGWLWAFWAMARAVSGRGLQAWSGRQRVAVLVVLVATCTLGGLAFTVSGDSLWVALALGGVEILVIGGALAASLWLLSRIRGVPHSPRRTAISGVGGTYSVLLILVFGSLVLGWMRPVGQTSKQILFNSLVMIAFNLVPLIWVLRLEPPAGSWNSHRFGLTPREVEIAQVIAEGLTNQEIAERLGISLATVKDHNHHLFRKMGVRNRTELSLLVRGSPVKGAGS